MGSADFPRYFEAQYAQYTEDIPFWLELALESRGPVLELGCGSGRVLLALAAAGLPIVGIDHDPGMLARAASHLPQESSHLVSLRQLDIRDYKLEGPFPLVISPCNTFALLPDDDFRQAATCAIRHLAPGGRLVLDLPPQTQTFIPVAEDSELRAAFEDLETGNPVQVSSQERVDPEGSRLHVTWLYDELLPDGRVERTEVPVTFHLRGPEALSRLFSGSGYQAIEYYADFQRRAYHPGSTRIIVSAST